MSEQPDRMTKIHTEQIAFRNLQVYDEFVFLSDGEPGIKVPGYWGRFSSEQYWSLTDKEVKTSHPNNMVIKKLG